MLKIQEQSEEVRAMSKSWPLIGALMAGTQGMRDAAELLLPKQPAEDLNDWTYRLGVATLFPAFERTLGVMAGKPFSKQVTLSDDVPASFAPWIDDIDMQDNSLHSFASDAFTRTMAFGFGGILVDFPRLVDVNTLADERAAQARPYTVFIRHDQILGWKEERYAGAAVLTQLRIAEMAQVDDGPYGTRCVKRVRLLMPGAVELWQEESPGSETYVQIDAYPVSIQQIPFVPLYGKKQCFMCGVSPLLNLAYLNVEHWQESSDQRDSARFARKRMLAVIGDETMTGEVVVASNFAMRLQKGADVKVVQGSAESVTVGRSEISILEDQMVQAGAELLIQKPGIRTATEANNDAEANKSDLQRIVETFEDSLDQVLQFMADWVGEKTGGNVTLFKDFSIFGIDNARETLLLNVRNAGVISDETLFEELQRSGMLSPDIEWEDEQARIADQPPIGGLAPQPLKVPVLDAVRNAGDAT